MSCEGEKLTKNYVVSQIANAVVFLNSQATLRLWTCVCGSLVPGHTCVTEMDRKLARKRNAAVFEHLEHGGAAMLNGLVGAETISLG